MRWSQKTCLHLFSFLVSPTFLPFHLFSPLLTCPFSCSYLLPFSLSMAANCVLFMWYHDCLYHFLIDVLGLYASSTLSKEIFCKSCNIHGLFLSLSLYTLLYHALIPATTHSQMRVGRHFPADCNSCGKEK